MKSSDLRIGNYNLFHGRLDRINDGYDIDHVRLDKKNEHTPIPLTMEWLVNLGLEYNTNEKQTFLVMYSFYIRDDHEDDGFDIYESVNDSFITTVQYVHQLQNLYFSLTQKELNYENITTTNHK